MDRSSLSIALLLASTLALLTGAVVGGAAAVVLWALGVPAVPGALALLALPARPGTTVAAGRRRALVVIGAATLGAQALLLLLAFGAPDGGPPAAGLPPATWAMLLGLGVLPLVGLPLVYALGTRE